MKNNKLVILISLIYLLLPVSGNAVTVTSNSSQKYTWKSATGEYVKSSSRSSMCSSSDSGCLNGGDNYKSANGEPYYCSSFGETFRGGTDCTAVSTWKKTSKNSVIVGNLIYYINNKSGISDSMEKYGRTAIAVNTYMSCKVKEGASKGCLSVSSTSYHNGNWLDKNSGISSAITYAEGEYNKLFGDSNFSISKKTFNDSVKITSSSGKILTFNSKVNAYISNKITFSGATAKVYNTDVEYTITASSDTANTVFLCTTAACDKNPVASMKVSGEKLNKTVLYLKALPTAKNVKINVAGSVPIKYYSSERYSCGQKLVKLIEVPVTLKGTPANYSFDFSNKTVKIKKTDSAGKVIQGAELKICTEATYKTSASNCAAVKTIDGYGTGAGTTVTLNPGTYYIVETKAPTGYKLDKSGVKFCAASPDGRLVDCVTKADLTEVIFKNEKIPEPTPTPTPTPTPDEVKVYKVDENNQALAGAEMEIVMDPSSACNKGGTKWTDNKLTFTSSTSAKTITNICYPGTFTLRETKAPAGYLMGQNNTITFKMDENGKLTDTDGTKISTTSLKIINYKEVKTPEPDPSYHRIIIDKNDEFGDLLKGVDFSLIITKDANFKITSTDDLKDTTKYTEISNNKSATIDKLFYYADKNNDDFYQHNYYIYEKNPIDGYVVNRLRTVYEKDGSNNVNETTRREVCYNTGSVSEETNDDQVDMSYCEPEKYDMICKDSQGNLDFQPEGGGCNIEEEKPEETPPAANDGETVDGEENGSVSQVNNKLFKRNIPKLMTETVEETPTTPNTWTEVCGIILDANGNKITDKSQLKEDTYDSKIGDHCSNKDSFVKVLYSSGNIEVSHINKRNSISISKRDITGEEEVPGAELKICTEADYKSKGVDCDAAKTIDDIEMSWTSGTNQETWNGVPKDTSYAIIEVVPPAGYQTATTVTYFTIDVDGNIKTGGKQILKDDIKDNPVVIKNGLNSLSISKTDIATSKELPGATISICLTTKNEDGSYSVVKESLTDSLTKEDYTEEELEELGIKFGYGDCIPVTLESGESAKWVSGDKPHEVVGLPAGTYGLVENIAPDGYSTAETIFFMMTEKGELTDLKGNSLKENKLVMKDKPIGDVKTGQLVLFIVIFILVVSILTFGITNSKTLKEKFNLNTISNEEKKTSNFNKRIKARKLHTKAK